MNDRGDQGLAGESGLERLGAHLRGRYGSQFEPYELSWLAQGESNRIARLNQDCLVRVAVATPNLRFQGDPQRVSRFEAALLQHLQGSGLTHTLVERHLEPSADFPYSYLITNFLSGGSLDYSPRGLALAAQALATLHRLPPPRVDRIPFLKAVLNPLDLFFQESLLYAQPYLEHPQADPDLVNLLQKVLRLCQRLREREPLLNWDPTRCLVHNDLAFGNWVIDSDRACLIDWEWAELNSPAADLGHLLSPITVRRWHHHSLPPTERLLFLETYWDALEDAQRVETLQHQFSVFGAFPAVRSLCWMAGYFIQTGSWYGLDPDLPQMPQILLLGNEVFQLLLDPQ